MESTDSRECPCRGVKAPQNECCNLGTKEGVRPRLAGLWVLQEKQQGRHMHCSAIDSCNHQTDGYASGGHQARDAAFSRFVRCGSHVCFLKQGQPPLLVLLRPL
jgi:hypothetical protein